MQIHNLTPHPITLYAADTPDRIDPEQYTPIDVIPVSEIYPPARMDTSVALTAEESGSGFPVVVYGATALPEPETGVYYIVALPVALAVQRPDLLTVGETVRNQTGTIIGARGLQRARAAF
jgi:hypothetical protein